MHTDGIWLQTVRHTLRYLHQTEAVTSVELTSQIGRCAVRVSPPRMQH